MSAKPMSTTMARSTPIATRPRLSVVLDPEVAEALPPMATGPARVFQSRFAELRSATPSAGPTKKPKVRKKYSTPEMLRIGIMLNLVKLFIRVEAISPSIGPSQAMAGDWMDTLANHFTDYADDKPVMKRAAPKAWEISASEYVFELLQALRRKDEFMAVVVLGRAAGVEWKHLTKADPLKRQRTMLTYIRLAAGWELVRLDGTRKNLVDKVNISP